MKRLTFLMALAGLFAFSVEAQAQTCVIINGKKCIVIVDPLGNPIDTNCNEGANLGTAGFSGPVAPPTGPINVTLNPVSVNVTINDPILGSVTTTLNPSPSNSATVKSNGPLRFPATVTLTFNGNASASTRPGITFRTRTPLVFTNPAVNSYNPFAAEKVTLTSDVEYYDAFDPLQRTQFVLQAGTELTLN